jgi:hypothetical protein
MTVYGIVRSRARRSAWQRMLGVKMTTCELTVWLGGALVVAFIAGLVGASF